MRRCTGLENAAPGAHRQRHWNDDMNPSPRLLRLVLVGAALYCGSTLTLAMPKAAEDESAQVSTGANAPKPKHSAVAPKPQVTAKKPAKAATAGHAKNSAKAAKPTPAGKPDKHAKKAGKAGKPAKPPKSSQHAKAAHGKK